MTWWKKTLPIQSNLLSLALPPDFFFYVAGFIDEIIPGKMPNNLMVKCMCFIPIGSMYMYMEY